MPELDTALEAKIAELRGQQLASWEAGDRILIESLLANHPELRANDDALLDLIYGEVLLREEFGIRPTVDEYVRRFPTCEAAIRRQFALHEMIGVLDRHGTGDDLTGSTVIDPALDRPDRTAPMVREKSDGKVWREVGPYEVREELGRGGMGVVYRGKHRTTGRLAAIKLLRCEGPEDRERFLTEARAMASLRHENIIGVFEVSDPRGEEPYVALEYIEGGSLEKVIAGTPLPPRDAASLLLPLAEAIDYAHSRGVIHRDLKPANVLLGLQIADCRLQIGRQPGVREGEAARRTGAAVSQSAICNLQSAIPKVTDFGLAKRLDADSSQTRTGAILGTPSYMAPEQARGSKDVGPAVDVYGLGAVLYETLTGRPPFKGDTVMNTLAQVADQDVVPPRSLQPGVPRDLETICLKCLEKSPEKRYGSAAALASDLKRFLTGEPILARRAGMIERAVKWAKRRPAAALLIGVSVAAVLGLIWFTFQLDAQKREAKEQAIEADRQTKIAEKEREEAQRQARIAEKQFIEAEKQRLEALAQSKRARHLLSLSANAVDDIAMAARDGKAYEKATGNTGTVLFKLACFYARTSKTLGNDADLVADDRKTLADQYAASAVRLLGCAQQVGFFEREKKENRERLDKDHDLAVLRARPDYKRWESRLP